MRRPVITAVQVEEMRRLRGDGLSFRQIAAIVGVSRETVKKYQSDQNVERKRVADRRATRRHAERSRQHGEPKGIHTIKTASTVVRALLLEAWRQRIPQQELAKRIGVSHSVVTLWKKGKAGPSMLSVEAMADVLGYELVLQKRDV
jgi:transcriptional regulator with XRE-family HTH domain